MVPSSSLPSVALLFLLLQCIALGFVLPPTSSPPATSHRLTATAQGGTSGQDGENEGSSSASGVDTDVDDTVKAKPMSRLAMAAADWLEEEEDELLSYWDRYDAAKSNSGTASADGNKSSAASSVSAETDLSTEERLDRYFESRGIDKSTEKKHAPEIESAVSYATNSASSASEAIAALEKVRPYLQVGSKLGGTALLELAYAYQAAASDQEDYEGEYKEICNAIIETNPLRELRLRAKQLLEEPTRYGKKYDKKGLWGSFDSLWK